MSHVPTDPTAPREPVRVPRGRPGTVSLVGVLMLGGAAVGFLHGVATIVTSAVIGRDLRAHLAALTTAPPAEIEDLGASVQGLFLVLGGAEAVLALGMVALAVGVLRGNTTARLSAVALALVSLACGAGGGLGTLGLGAGSDVTVTLGGSEVEVGEPLRAAVPGWFTSLTGGLGCLQSLSYILSSRCCCCPPRITTSAGGPLDPPPESPPEATVDGPTAHPPAHGPDDGDPPAER